MIIGYYAYCPHPTAKILRVGKPKGKEECIHRVIYIDKQTPPRKEKPR